MNGSVSVYMRDDQVIIVPEGGGGGVYFELDDIRIVGPSEPEVQRAIEEGIQASAEASGGPLPDLRTRKSPVLRHLGLKSARAFNVNLSHCSVFAYNGKVEIHPYRPARSNRGFEGHGDPIPVDDIKSLGSLVLRVLSESPRMNPAGTPPRS